MELIFKKHDDPAIPWKRIKADGYVFPWAGWKEVVLENYAVDTAFCKHRGFAPETMRGAVWKVKKAAPCLIIKI